MRIKSRELCKPLTQSGIGKSHVFYVMPIDEEKELGNHPDNFKPDTAKVCQLKGN